MARSEDAVVPGTATAVGTPARLFRATALVCGLFLAGMAGYMVVEGAPWFEALYMTVITITTVGFSEAIPLSPAGRVLTMALLVAGLGIFFFLASEIGRAVMEGELRRCSGTARWWRARTTISACGRETCWWSSVRGSRFRRSITNAACTQRRRAAG